VEHDVHLAHRRAEERLETATRILELAEDGPGIVLVARVVAGAERRGLGLGPAQVSSDEGRSAV
jgi:predicted GNAT family N-acyltransferase